MVKKSSYAQIPAVPAKKVAGTNPVGKVAVGSGKPGIVPEKAGFSRGLTPKNEFKQPKPHGFSNKIKHRGKKK